MNDVTPTRSAVIALGEERRAMQEGYVFLDEKCLLLAGAMLRELRRFDAARERLQGLLRAAGAALAAALGRHGLEGLQCHPAPDPAGARVHEARRSLLGVVLQDARLESLASAIAEPVWASPEAGACRAAFAAVAGELVAMAAISGNLERLHREYRRTVRRVRAIQDVLLPELDRTLADIEARLEELEQDEALAVRRRRR